MWAIVLLLLGLALVVMEAFIPSGGVLGFLAALAFVGAVVFAFISGPVHGAILLFIAVFGTPVLIVLMLKWWPRTPIGRRILLGVPSSDDVLPDRRRRRELRELVGHIGQAKSVMLPSGPVLIHGRIIDAVSEGMAIEAGQKVEVVEVRGSRVVVRPYEGDEEVEQKSATGADDLLTRPIDSLGIDPFEGDTVT